MNLYTNVNLKRAKYKAEHCQSLNSSQCHKLTTSMAYKYSTISIILNFFQFARKVPADNQGFILRKEAQMNKNRFVLTFYVISISATDVLFGQTLISLLI